MSNRSSDSFYHSLSITIPLDHFVGEPPITPKSNSIYHLYYGNPNGLTINNQQNDLLEYIETVSLLQVDTICLYEHNFNTLHHKMNQTIHTTCKNHHDHHKLTISSSSVPSKSSFKPGGTLTITNGKFTGHIIETTQDPLGIWTTQTFTGKNHQQMTVISTYQPCVQSLHTNDHVHTLTVYYSSPSFSL